MKADGKAGANGCTWALPSPAATIRTAQDTAFRDPFFKCFENTISKWKQKAQTDAISISLLPPQPSPQWWCCLADPGSHLIGPLLTGL